MVNRVLVSLIDQLIHRSTAAELVAVAPGKLHTDGGTPVNETEGHSHYVLMLLESASMPPCLKGTTDLCLA